MNQKVLLLLFVCLFVRRYYYCSLTIRHTIYIYLSLFGGVSICLKEESLGHSLVELARVSARI